MKYYNCNNQVAKFDDTVIEVTDESFISSRFCIVKKYKTLYQEELHRFQNKLIPIYGLPFHKEPEHIYNGIGRIAKDTLYLKRKEYKKLSKEDKELYHRYKGYEIQIYFSDLFQKEDDAMKYLSFLSNRNNYEIVWTRIYGSNDTIPHEYHFIGYDVTYSPDCDGAFSIICDCMFICMWHGCDSEGTDFLSYFHKLNMNGLFNTVENALDYLQHYISFDWTERGQFYITEIYMRDA